MTPEELANAIHAILLAAAGDGSLDLPVEQIPVPRVERPRNREHGDWSTNVAMQLAKRAGTGPRDLAELLASRLEALDGVVSGLRAGLGVGESLAGLAEHGPDAMRAPFARFADRLRATGRLDPALDGLKREMADPVADRVAEAMRLASRLGGHDLAGMMEALSRSLRMENRARGELLARQSWTVNGARVAAAAPWAVLALLSTRPRTVEAFSTSAGTFVLLGGLAATAVAYALMARLGRLPSEPRVLAGDSR